MSTPAEFADRARRYYQDYLPQAYAQIGDPAAFFRNLGERIADQVDEAARRIEGPSPAGEDYLGRVGRINMARMQAAELVMDNEVYSTPPETEVEHDEDAEDAVTPEVAELVAGMRETLQLLREVNEELAQIRMGQAHRELRREMHPEP